MKLTDLITRTSLRLIAGTSPIPAFDLTIQEQVLHIVHEGRWVHPLTMAVGVTWERRP